MGLSRNKVAVSEGAAGSPPFYGEKVGAQKGDDKSADLLKSSTFVVQFSVTEEWVILTKASPILTGIFPLVLLQ